MKAVGFKRSLPIENPESLFDFKAGKPVAVEQDILVKIEAISVNPVDCLVRQSAATDESLETPRILGWDAVGTVEAVGEAVTLFGIGDRVFYAGDINRAGSYAEYQAIDQRLVGHAPKRVSTAQAAAMPLTSLTAYELLFDRLHLTEADEGKSILIIGGSGGLGSITIQLAKRAGLVVIATSSREDSAAWCRQMGADHVVGYQNLRGELASISYQMVDYIVEAANLESYWDVMVDIIKPQGHIASVTNSSKPLNLDSLKAKSVSFSWEYVYTRSSYQTEDMERQHLILEQIAMLLDSGELRSTLNSTIEGFSAENLRRAHALQQSGTTIGKRVILF